MLRDVQFVHKNLYLLGGLSDEAASEKVNLLGNIGWDQVRVGVEPYVFLEIVQSMDYKVQSELVNMFMVFQLPVHLKSTLESESFSISVRVGFYLFPQIFQHHLVGLFSLLFQFHGSGCQVLEHGSLSESLNNYLFWNSPSKMSRSLSCSIDVILLIFDIGSSSC